MKNKEFKLLVENWKSYLNEEDCVKNEILEENIFKNLKSIGPSVVIGLLSQIGAHFADIPSSDAQAPEEIASVLEDNFENNSHFLDDEIEFEAESNGSVSAYLNGKKMKNFLSAEQCKNISAEELKNLARYASNDNYSKIRKMINYYSKAKEEITNNNSNSVLEKINNLDNKTKKEIIKRAEGNSSFNVQFMQYNIVAKNLFKDNPEDFNNNQQNALIFAIVKFSGIGKDYGLSLKSEN